MKMNKDKRIKVCLEEEILDELTQMAIESNQSRNSLVMSILDQRINNIRQYRKVLDREQKYIKHIFKMVMGEETKFESTLIRTYKILESLAYLQHKKYMKNPELLQEQGRYIEYNLAKIRAGLPMEQPFMNMKKALMIEADPEILRRIKEMESQADLAMLDEDDESE